MKQVKYTDCMSVEDHYKTSIDKLSDKYVSEYIKYLPHIREYMKRCNSYRELGTNQGASASAAILEIPEFIQLIDVSFSKFAPFEHYFKIFAEKNNIKFDMIEENSLSTKVNESTEFLLIDSVHKYNHVLSELKKYSILTEKYIMIHDTVGFPEVGRAVNDFLQFDNTWRTNYHYNHPKAGYTVLEKIS